MARRHVAGGVDAVVVPGGFAHGDYLRPGAIARFSPVMDARPGLRRRGGPVVGICNGFQVLTEAGLLPGRAAEEPRPKFLCTTTHDPGRDHETRADRRGRRGRRAAHPDQPLRGQLHLRRRDARRAAGRRPGRVRYVDNPNGSVDDIAGICNEGRNVVGLMPHPERACHRCWAPPTGPVLLRSLLRQRRRADRSVVGRQLERLMPARLSTAGLDAQLAPGRVRDALAAAL